MQCRWWEQNASVLPGRDTPEGHKTFCVLWEIQVGHYGSNAFEERGSFCAAWGWSRAGGGQEEHKAKHTSLSHNLVERSPGFRLRCHSGNIPQTWHHYSSHPLLLPSEPILLNWAPHPPQINKILYQAAQHWWMLVSPNNKAQLLEFSELFFFSPSPACKQHKLVIKKIQLSESFMMVWAREKFADQRL